MDLQGFIDELEARGVVVAPWFLSPEEAGALAHASERAWAAGEFKRAGVGRHGVRDDIRRDEILWWDPTALGPAQRVLWDRLESLREGINARLFLGLWELEAHYARYAPGAFYSRHVDRFADDDARVLSTVFYLNRDWGDADGGKLRVYPPPPGLRRDEPETTIDVIPALGTLVTFWSDRIPHEVLPTDRTRQSVAAWFRRRSLA